MGKVETWKENTLLSDLQRSTFMNWQVYEAERDDNLVGLKNLACRGFFFPLLSSANCYLIIALKRSYVLAFKSVQFLYLISGI